jgi:hypothetical protein
MCADTDAEGQSKEDILINLLIYFVYFISQDPLKRFTRLDVR